MARLARVVVPGVAHHVTQRGNRRQQTFFTDGDYTAYRALLAEACTKRAVTCQAYCLMPNHVHLVLTPATADGLAGALAETHRRYTRFVNAREGWTGYLWQGRFASFPMDDAHLLAAIRYVELNPVRARLAARPQDWPWSSAAAHLAGRDDALVRAAAMRELTAGWPGGWGAFLAEGLGDAEADRLRRHERTGRPLGSDAFLDRLERRLARPLRPQKPGPKPRTTGN